MRFSSNICIAAKACVYILYRQPRITHCIGRREITCAATQLKSSGSARARYSYALYSSG